MHKCAHFRAGLSKGMTMGRPNPFHLAHSADKGGALRNQVYVGGHFQLAAAEAFVTEPNAGGTWTYVISNADPLVHNWVDPWGLTEGILTLRMAEFPGQRPTDDL